MPLLRWGPWTPDVADYEGPGAKNILNVIPRGDGYGPFPSFAALTKNLPAPCRGGFYALKSDGSVVVFAATVDRLYQLNNTDFSWTPVSIAAPVSSISHGSPAAVTFTNTFANNDPVAFSTTGTLPAPLVAGQTYYVTLVSGVSFALSATPGGAPINTTTAGSGTHSITTIYPVLTSTAQWQFAQTGNFVFAAQANVPLQVFNLASPATFTISLGSPPQAAYISVVGRFLVLSGLLSQAYRIVWSGLNDFNSSTSWTAGLNSSDFQDFPDGGIVRGVAGGEFGVIFQDQAIRSMSYVQGDVIFQIQRLTQDMGLYAPYSIIRAGATIFFYAGQGFQRIDAGGVPTQIGRERVDRTFLADLDKGSLQLFMGAADPRGTRIYWAYKSVSGVVGLYDKLLGYDIALDRFFQIAMSGEYLLGISQSGLTLENLDTISSSIDALAVSLDSFATAVQPQIAHFSSGNLLGFFTGPNLEATLESSEQGTAGTEIYVDGFRPITDAPTVFGSLDYRQTQAQIPTTSAEAQMNARTGYVNLRREARYIRFKERIPAATLWTFAAGIEPNPELSGTD